MADTPFDDDIEAVVRVHGLSAPVGLDLRALVDKVIEEITRSSLPPGIVDVLSGTMLEDDPVTLTPGMAQALPPRAIEPSRETLVLEDGPAPARTPVGLSRTSREDSPGRSIGPYEDLGALGKGAMGDVRRIVDSALNRAMAAKIIRFEALRDDDIVARFIEEAQITAQLDHPGIVPVHELGRLGDGRFFFTMKEVHGRTLDEVIREVHASPGAGPLLSASGTMTVRKLIEAFRRVCEAVAYAHSRGVVHRDLKPHNIMIGEFGEVLVLDWGLAKVLGRPDRVAASGRLQPPRVGHDRPPTQDKVGQIAGTPMYMPPEQAKGRVDKLGPPSDVYALGAVLYEILCGHAPFSAASVAEVLDKVVEGLTEPLEGLLPIPEELREICERAMSLAPGDRYPHAGVLAEAIEAWLEGAERTEVALELVDQAEALAPRITQLRSQAQKLRREAEMLLGPVRSHDPVSRKRPGWQRQDEAARLQRQAGHLEREYTRTLHTALNQAPDLPIALYMLGNHYARKLGEAEQARDGAEAAIYEKLLRSVDNGLYGDLLIGDGALTLVTDPPGAEVLLHRYELRDRRLVPIFQRWLGQTPLERTPLAMGAYLLVIRAPGHAEVRYPISIGREQHWDGMSPEGGVATPILLLKPEDITEEEAYVPAGWFRAGGDPMAANSGEWQRIWVDGFIARKTPVSNAEFILFLDDLVATGREEQALEYAPRERPGRAGELGSLIYGRKADGRFVLRADADGDTWGQDWPVLLVTWHAACAFADWSREQTGLPWRLPSEWEWEKSARGTDGRFYPWGDFLDPSWTCIRGSHAKRPLPAPVGTNPVDESPYGVRDLCGNVRDWCADAWTESGRVSDNRPGPGAVGGKGGRVVRGGGWFSTPDGSRSAWRGRCDAAYRLDLVGFRLVRSI